MFCGNCGNEVTPNAVACMKCGANPRIVIGFCTSCGTAVAANAVVCTNCGVSLARGGTGIGIGGAGKSRLVVGLLGIFLGSLGVHNFILGYTGKAIAQLLLTLIGGWLFGLGALAAWIWALVESIQILSKKVNVDANGIPLVD